MDYSCASVLGANNGADTVLLPSSIMPSRRTTIVLIAILAAGIIAISVSHGANANKPTARLRVADQASFAEISTTSPQMQTSMSASSTTINLPILVYHIVRPSYPSDSPAVRALAHTPETFDAEMNYLKSAGYHVVQFSDLENYFANGVPLQSKPIILSFDDGWGDQFTYAFPILQKYNYTATFFVFTNAIGRKGFFTWDELRTMIAAGMTIGDHSRFHPYLTRITSTSTLWSEIYVSKQVLEKRLGIPINEFAYPFGLYNPDIISLVREAGYKSARGDFYKGDQSSNRLFELSAINAPTTISGFKRLLPTK